MSLPQQIETWVGYVEKYQNEFFAAQTVQEKLKASANAKLYLDEIKKDVDRNARDRPRNRRAEHKQLLETIGQHSRSFSRYIKAKREDPTASPIASPANCSELLERLRALYYEG